MKTNNFRYPFFVEYIEDGMQCCDTWSAETLREELARGEVKIVSVELAYNIQVALGIAED